MPISWIWFRTIWWIYRHCSARRAHRQCTYTKRVILISTRPIYYVTTPCGMPVTWARQRLCLRAWNKADGCKGTRLQSRYIHSWMTIKKTEISAQHEFLKPIYLCVYRVTILKYQAYKRNVSIYFLMLAFLNGHPWLYTLTHAHTHTHLTAKQVHTHYQITPHKHTHTPHIPHTHTHKYIHTHGDVAAVTWDWSIIPASTLQCTKVQECFT